MQKRSITILIALAVALFFVWQVYQLSKSVLLSSMRETSEARLNLYAGTVRGALEKYSYLPLVLAKNHDIQNVLQGPGDVRQVNRYLTVVNKQAGSAVLFIMNPDGVTLCSSNWHEKLSFVGRNYGFRPYFKDAMGGMTSGFFAIGVTTSRPGYFISAPIYNYSGSTVAGVAVVKIDLTPLERSWLEGGEMVLVGDKNGVLFLSSLPQYKYKSLERLDAETIETIKEEKQYHTIDIQPLEFKKSNLFADDVISLSGASYLLSSRELPKLKWRIYYLASLVEAQKILFGTVIIAAVTLFLILLLSLYFRERRLKRISNRRASHAQKLAKINKRLQREIKEHSRTEQELRETQQEVIQAGKLAALGQMSTVVSHELNQPIAAIRTYAASCRKFFEKDNKQMVLQNLDIIKDLTEHMGSITSQLKAFARKSGCVAEPVPLQDRISRVQFMLENQICPAGVFVNMDLCEQEVIVMTDPVKIDQILVNLIRNSIDAMKNTDKKQLDIHLSINGPEAELRIADSGHGIDPTSMEHLFEPFFTTKDAGDGLGLGLSITFRIIKEIGGSIQATENHFGGATFIVRLPLHFNDQPGTEKNCRNRKQKR